MFNKIKYLLIFIYLPCLLSAQQIGMEIDSTTITEHDEVFLRLKIFGAAKVTKYEVKLEELRDLEGVEIIEEFPWDSLNMNGDVVREKKIKLTSRDSGLYWIPGLRMSYSANGKRYAKMTERIPLKVNPFVISTPEPRAIRGIKEEPFSWQDLIPLFVVLAIIASLGLGAYWYWKSKKKEEEVELPPPVIPAHEIALTKLKNLDQAKLWQQGQVKEYISQLTYIEREYLENRFGIQALESTTAEIIHDLKDKDISQGHKEDLSQMFRMADMVKFAKAEPPADIHSKLMDQAEDFIQKTKKLFQKIEEVDENKNDIS